MYPISVIICTILAMVLLLNLRRERRERKGNCDRWLDNWVLEEGRVKLPLYSYIIFIIILSIPVLNILVSLVYCIWLIVQYLDVKKGTEGYNHIETRYVLKSKYFSKFLKFLNKRI